MDALFSVPASIAVEVLTVCWDVVEGAHIVVQTWHFSVSLESVSTTLSLVAVANHFDMGGHVRSVFMHCSVTQHHDRIVRLVLVNSARAGFGGCTSGGEFSTRSSACGIRCRSGDLESVCSCWCGVIGQRVLACHSVSTVGREHGSHSCHGLYD